MASATSLMTDDNFSCSICLDVFTKPVSIPCGHTFCQDCITKHWETVNRLFECPLCKETYLTKPMLRVNIFIADMAERFKKAVRRKSSSTLQEEPVGKVLCNLCIDPKSAAVKSCLVCFMSFCTIHLQPHQTLPNLQRHKLIQPVNDLQNRLCKTHSEPFEFFCREDQMFLCLSFGEKQQYAVDVTFDPDTAHPLLNVSADGKQVATGYQKKNVDNKPQRFQKVLNILAKEGFSSGKFYYEVQVKGKTQWDLGVVSESINRKGDIRLSPKNGYWTIWFRNGDELTANACPAVNLPVRQIPEKVGVFVDYEEGQVSFYDVDARAAIFSFMGNSFTTKLFPFFSP